MKILELGGELGFISLEQYMQIILGVGLVEARTTTGVNQQFQPTDMPPVHNYHMKSAGFMRIEQSNCSVYINPKYIRNVRPWSDKPDTELNQTIVIYTTEHLLLLKMKYDQFKEQLTNFINDRTI